jgi:cbb3-type cytochrome c oxidase subunit II
MRMTPKVVVVGSFSILAAVVFVMVCWPYAKRDMTPSSVYRSRTPVEAAGRAIYVQNGCVYCHTQSIRAIDWGHGAERIAQAGDYVGDRPILLGSQRTGVDLSQEGGEHPDDWHIAHFVNPRYTRSNSIMPPFKWLGIERLETLTQYIQSLGMKEADVRMERQRYWKKEAVKAFEGGPDANVKWLAEIVPEGWRHLPNPYPTTPAGLERGHMIYQQFCIGCHGPIGDGMGPAQPYLYPPPLNFTILKGREISGGIIYYQLMNGITGTAMPYFKRELESQKIWEVGDYVAVYFINQSDANQDPRGIDASWEP